MRPYYTGNVEARLKKLSLGGRRRVLAHAREQALHGSHSGDIDRHLYVVTPSHMAECGYSTVGRVLPISVEEEFLDYALKLGFHEWGERLTRQELRQAMKIRTSSVRLAFTHFKAGWSRRADVEL